MNGPAEPFLAQAKTQPGKDIWLFGGGVLLRSMLDAQLVDQIELAVMPVLLGSGIPLLPPGRAVTGLRVVEQQTTPNGIVRLTYAVPRPADAHPTASLPSDPR